MQLFLQSKKKNAKATLLPLGYVQYIHSEETQKTLLPTNKAAQQENTVEKNAILNGLKTF